MAQSLWSASADLCRGNCKGLKDSRGCNLQTSRWALMLGFFPLFAYWLICPYVFLWVFCQKHPPKMKIGTPPSPPTHSQKIEIRNIYISVPICFRKHPCHFSAPHPSCKQTVPGQHASKGFFFLLINVFISKNVFKLISIKHFYVEICRKVAPASCLKSKSARFS